jgi:hypothetical protein
MKTYTVYSMLEGIRHLEFVTESKKDAQHYVSFWNDQPYNGEVYYYKENS